MAWLLGLTLWCAAGPGDVAANYLAQCHQGKFGQAASVQDAAMSKALPTDKLRDLWAMLKTQNGELQSIGKPRDSRSEGDTTVLLRCSFEKIELDAKVVVDANGKVAGLFFVPPGSEKITSAAYVDPKLFSEREIVVGAEGWPLKGTMTLPINVGKPPVMILVHGSGPHDRDEKIGPNFPFQDLAHGLASQGIAVVRYEKRTFAHKAKLAKAADSLTLNDELIEDALATAKWCRQQPDFDSTRIYLLGHSLGGSCAPEIARRDAKLAGIVILAGANRTPDVMILDQLKYILTADPAQTEGVKKMLAELEPQLNQIKQGTLKPDEKVMGISPTYWKSWMDLTPAQTAAGLAGLPILVLQGGRDYQVTEIDFNAFHTALDNQPTASFHLYDDLNHLFHTGKLKAVPNDYQKPGHVDPRVIHDIAEWVNGPNRPSK